MSPGRKSRTRTQIAAMTLAIAITGCASDSILGKRAEEARDYVAAREAYRRELTSALQQLPATAVTRTRVILATYDLGRMTGSTCDYAEAEKLLREALRLSELQEERFSFRTAILSELARLTFDAGEFEESVSFYQRAIQRLDRFQVVDRDPIAFANFLDDYATALERASIADKATQARGRAASIRSSNRGKKALFTPVYYRDVCGLK